MENYDLITNLVGKASSTAKLQENNIVTSSSTSYPSSLLQLPYSSCSPTFLSTSSTDQLIGILADSNAGIGVAATRKPICIEPKLPRRREIPAANILQVQLQRGVNVGAVGKCSSNAPGKQKIPRPANAFMLFANEWRKKLAVENPRESNKDISVRLGVLWKNMTKDIKEKYFALAREVDAEHKRKYPDYVYNPKEARLRKAMREQSRELSRQSILQTAIASNAGTATATGIGGSSSINSNRIINPWFPVDHAAPTSHLKPILSPRVMAVHQRTLDKTKEAKRKQVECGALGAFSAGSATAGYTGDFATGIAGAGSCAGQGSNEYCVIAEFGDGQKWHPYQNGANAYHARGAAMSKIGALHPNVQNTNLHGHGPWTQFCGLPLPTSAAKNTVIRGPRHMVFLQEQQNQHCNFSDEMQLPYIPSKVEVNHRLHVAYPQADHQSKNAVSPSLHMSHHQDNDKCMENGPRWESGVSAAEPVISNLVAGRESALLQEQNQDRKLEQESCRSLDRDESLKQKMNCKQPLPGFHQAFGSTEIGRFSRSEFFANMVGENSNPIPEAYLTAPVFPFSPTSQSVLGNPTMTHGTSLEEDLLQQIMSEDCYWLGAGAGHSTSGLDAASNYAAFLDYSHRLSQEWLHPATVAQDLQAAFIEQPACLFHESNCGLLGGHDHLTYSSSSSSNSSSINYPCSNFEQNREVSATSMLNESASLNLQMTVGVTESDDHENDIEEPDPVNPKMAKSFAVVEENDEACAILDAKQVKLDKNEV